MIQFDEAIVVGKFRIMVPADIEVRITMEPRSISIGTYPHSPKGERFVYESTDEMKSEFISAVLAREHGLSRNNLTLNHEAGRK